MSVICPTVTCQTEDVHEYRRQMEKVEYLTNRIQVDLMDGDFAPTKSPPFDHIWFPEHLQIDLHLMFRHPALMLNNVLEIKPSLLIVHAESEVDIPTLSTAIRESNIKMGLALLPETNPEHILDELEYLDHVLIFSGNLGHFGGAADLSLLRKVEKLKRYKPDLEIGWDGGANLDTVKQLSDGGVDVINVGGFIQLSENPKSAFEQLTTLIQS